MAEASDDLALFTAQLLVPEPARPSLTVMDLKKFLAAPVPRSFIVLGAGKSLVASFQGSFMGGAKASVTQVKH